MTGPTHAVIAVSCGMMVGCSTPSLVLLTIGAVLPDLDHPRSVIGRVFFPFSIPLHRRFGHRGPVHSFWFWWLLAMLGTFWHPFFLIGTGGLLHVFTDCYTVSGVRAMAPWSNKVFVMFQRSWRLKSGSNAEFALLAVFGAIAWLGFQVGEMGGTSAMLGYLTSSPKIMEDEFRRRGLEKCYVEGQLRWNNGKIEKGRWLIIGSEGSGLALQGDNRLIHLPQHGYFMRAKLTPTGEYWEQIQLHGWSMTKSNCYFLDKGRWHVANSGDAVFGQIIGNDISLGEIK
jgi:membrane-bound metal-dependent hydrolase YbcI (DUF457 family)